MGHIYTTHLGGMDVVALRSLFQFDPWVIFIQLVRIVHFGRDLTFLLWSSLSLMLKLLPWFV